MHGVAVAVDLVAVEDRHSGRVRRRAAVAGRRRRVHLHGDVGLDVVHLAEVQCQIGWTCEASAAHWTRVRSGCSHLLMVVTATGAAT